MVREVWWCFFLPGSKTVEFIGCSKSFRSVSPYFSRISNVKYFYTHIFLPYVASLSVDGMHFPVTGRTVSVFSLHEACIKCTIYKGQITSLWLRRITWVMAL